MQFSRVEPRSQLALSFLFICCSIKPALAHDHFNPLSLENDEPGVENVDLSVFEKGGQAEGTYNVDIYINNTSVETKNIAFKKLNLQSKCNKKRSTHQLEYNFVSTQKPFPNDEYFLPTSYNKRA
ncbi:hypothetical protein OV431_22590, partial [Salmonella enterica subsp. enterica serovar 1,4,[5],12:i:-]|nr:hypothetical protein [Salmonella enterica subsp. enterica serovar 1,4,[5],12:i:-]MCY5497816.1 hypothetical protein [Salmonella enterica subsp. enterica serovar 1,4,[5],12:i:-]